MLELDQDLFTQEEKARIAKQEVHKSMYLSSYTRSVVGYGADGKVSKQSKNPVAPIPATISEIFSDLLFLEFPEITYNDETLDELIKPVLDEMVVPLLEASSMNSAIGMLWWVLWKDDDEVSWKFKEPQSTTWETDVKDNLINIKFYKLEEEKKDGSKVYRVLEHELAEGKNEAGETLKQGIVIEYIVHVDVNGKVSNISEVQAKSTGLDFIPVVKVLNIGQLNQKIGRSDYRGKEDMFSEIDQRIDQINYVLQEQAEPWTFVPPGVLNAYGKFDRQNGKMVQKAPGGAGDNNVEFSTWDASLSASFEAIKAMVKMVFFTSRISAPIAGLDDGGQAESGRALKWRSINTFSAVGRRRIYWTKSIQQFFKYLSKIDPTYSVLQDKTPSINWADGLPMDETEITERIIAQVNAGLLSRVEAVKQLHELDDEKAADELTKIITDRTEEANRNNIPLINL